jgi:hypothetical protein
MSPPGRRFGGGVASTTASRTGGSGGPGEGSGSGTGGSRGSRIEAGRRGGVDRLRVMFRGPLVPSRARAEIAQAIKSATWGSLACR